jgi:chromosome segregation ATPase
MKKLGSFFGRKPSVPAVGDKSVVADIIAVPEILATPRQPQKPQNVVVALDDKLFLPIARQLGEDNESIRNLLIDAEHKINELDAIKRAIGKLVEPVSKTLRALEEAKSELSTSEKKVTLLESECTRRGEALTVTQQKLTALESTEAEQTTELSARRAQIADLQGRVLQQGEEIQVAHDEIRRLSERMALSDKKTLQLESECEATRQKLMVSENDRTTAQKSLNKAFAEMSHMSERLLDTDKVLATTQIRMHNAEQKLVETQTDHRRLATELDDAKQKHQSEIVSLNRNYATLQTRATMTNKLLEDTRKNMLERAEEIQSFDRRLGESLQPNSETHHDAGGSHSVARKRGQDDPAGGG